MARQTSTYDGRLWAMLARAEWRAVRQERRALRRLQEPNFAFSHGMTRTLGQWNEVTRTITLSSLLLEPQRWHHLVSTLRHEVAHQVVSELFGGGDASPHGPLFRRACTLVGISTEASATAAELEERREEPTAVRMVRKLLALSGSTNRHEAEVALAKAQELALKHSISLAAGDAAPRYEFRLLDQPRKRWPSYTWAMLAICEKLHQCRYLQFRLPSGEGVIEIFGFADNLDLAEHAYHYLKHTGEVEWQRYRAENGLGNNRQRLSFLTALYAAFEEKLGARHERFRTQDALVLASETALDAAFRRRHPRISRSGTSFIHHADAAQAGREVGKNLRIQAGVPKSKRGGAPKALPAGRGS